MPGTKHFVVVPLGLIAVQSAFVTCHSRNFRYHNHMYLTFILTQRLDLVNPPHPHPAGAAVRGLFIWAPGAYFGIGWYGSSSCDGKVLTSLP